MPVDIVICGAMGRMGRAIIEAARDDADIRVVGLVESSRHPRIREVIEINGNRVTVSPGLTRHAGAVVVDFTTPETTATIVREAVVNGNPCVIGTTGLSTEQMRDLEHAARRIPIVFSSNMSAGINILWKLAAEAARLLGDSADVEIIEAHHNRKKDAPSGTAVTMAIRINEALGKNAKEGWIHGREGMPGERPKGEVGIHSVRAGDIPGDHTVLFGMEGERLELIHRAHDRTPLARGALLAARFAAKAGPGLHSMAEVLGMEGKM